MWAHLLSAFSKFVRISKEIIYIFPYFSNKNIPITTTITLTAEIIARSKKKVLFSQLSSKINCNPLNK
jgi:hypothetical protein